MEIKYYIQNSTTDQVLEAIFGEWDFGDIIKNSGWDYDHKISASTDNIADKTIYYNYLKDPKVNKFFESSNKIWWKYVKLTDQEIEDLDFNFENLNSRQIYFFHNKMVYVPNIFYSSELNIYGIKKVIKTKKGNKKLLPLNDNEINGIRKMIISIINEGTINAAITLKNMDEDKFKNTNRNYKRVLRINRSLLFDHIQKKRTSGFKVSMDL